MTSNRRIWRTPEGTVCVRLAGGVREFWSPPRGGFIREIDARHPGALGRQVCDQLAYTGRTLRAASRSDLIVVIRSEYRRLAAAARRDGRPA